MKARKDGARMIGRFIQTLSFACVAWLATTGFGAEASTSPLLLQNPTISRTSIAFTYGASIWIVDRAGGVAHALVSNVNVDALRFSPDGSMLAYSANDDGVMRLYVIAASGGEPRRLTSHPAGAIVAGWTPDGRSVLFASSLASATDPNSLFTVPVTGGYPTRLPLPMAETGAYSPDGTHLAYVPNFRWEPFWRGYRGGQTTPIYIADLADSSIVAIPRDNSNDDSPMWTGNDVYFLSDRDGPVTLFSYDIRARRVTRVLANDGIDITAASLGAGAIVYSQFGALHVYDVATHADATVAVTLAADLPQTRPHWEHVGTHIENAGISPSGIRAVFEARGTIFTVPAEHGDVRNISGPAAGPSAVANRDPAWSPDGKSIAYFSDRSGEYELLVRDQRGLAPPRAIPLGPNPSYYYNPTWSPDSKKIAYTDKHLNLWYVDLARPVPVKVAHGLFEAFEPNTFNAAWSPDSRWITYATQLPNYLHAAFVYDLILHETHQITDGMSDVRSPRFDANGKYLYFAASVNTGLTPGGLDMVSDGQSVSSRIFAAVLPADIPSPVTPLDSDERAKAASDVPKSTDEPMSLDDQPSAAPPQDALASPAPRAGRTTTPAAAKALSTAIGAAKAPAKIPTVKIDFGGLSQRIVALPIPEANYLDIATGHTGEIFLTAAPVSSVEPGPPRLTVTKFDLTTRMANPFVQGVSAFALAARGTTALYERAARWYIVPTMKPPDGGAPIDTASMEASIDPPAQWRQIYHETWRIERDFFYDDHYHGLNLAAAEKRFAPYLAGVASRADLTFLMREMLSYLSVGHMFIRGGDTPSAPPVKVGLLGADYTIENGRYRFAKIYGGLNWNPELQAPLTQPGLNVHAGDYLLAVNGHALGASDDLYRAFEETAQKETSIRVGPSADGEHARDIVVTPVPSEFPLRNYDWIEHNRQEVDRLSGGKLGYVYMPDTGYGGFTNFNRYFFAQIGKQGVILDERFNHGGQIADYVIDYLARKPQSILQSRDGILTLDPPLAIYGPKVMLINQFAGSGGDAMPWYFRRAHLGPLVGVRTWGGLVGIGGYPSLIDGGSVTAPRVAIGGLHGQWEVENHGIAPDIEVMQDPKLVREGHDPQLEAGVKEALRLLREHPLPTYVHPPWTDHKPVLPPTAP